MRLTTRRQHLRKTRKGLRPIRQHPLRFNPARTLDRLDAGLLDPTRLTEKQKLLVIQEQEKRQSDAKRKRHARTVYEEAVEREAVM